MPARPLPSPEYLRQRLRYEPETGKLYWRYYEPRGPRWNGRYAGTEALTAPNTGGYQQGSLDGTSLCAHNVVWAMAHSVWTELDHIDHDKRNNRLGNLRPSDDAINARNRPAQRNNTSGVTGVHWASRKGLWVAQIGTGAGQHQLGYFDDFEAAVAARKAAEVERGFHPNHGAKP